MGKQQNIFDSPAGEEANEPSFKPPAHAGCDTLPFNFVLEGGSMRGQFTAGILDFFMENKLWAERVVGTSAGALCGYNYVAGDIGRTCYLNTKYCDDWRYLSLKSFARTGNAYGVEFSFDEIPNTLEPFDYDAFRQSPVALTTVASNLETGEADYFTFGDPKDNIEYLAASASVPLLSKIVEIDGKKLLDGGACDSVPLLYSILSGAEKHLVVLTQDETYVKPPNKLMTLIRQVYSDYPYFCERLQNRHIDYNRMYRLLPRLHEAGCIYVLRPQEPVTISNMEKDPEKLLDLYEKGYREAVRNYEAVLDYLEAPPVSPLHFLS